MAKAAGNSYSPYLPPPRQSSTLLTVCDEFRQNPIQSQDIVLGLETGRTEQVANVVCRGKTDTEIVRHIVVTELFVLDQHFGKI